MVSSEGVQVTIFDKEGRVRTTVNHLRHPTSEHPFAISVEGLNGESARVSNNETEEVRVLRSIPGSNEAEQLGSVDPHDTRDFYFR